MIDTFVLLCVGILEPRKAQASLVESFATVASAFPEAILVLVGDHSSGYSDAVHMQARRLGIASRVRFEQITKDVYRWYGVADALVSASDIESLPRSVLEAMAFGVPVAATEIFGLPELLTDGRTGWLFRDRDLDSLTAVLVRMLSTPVDERRAPVEPHGSRG